jgi:hypothetical protein
MCILLSQQCLYKKIIDKIFSKNCLSEVKIIIRDIMCCIINIPFMCSVFTSCKGILKDSIYIYSLLLKQLIKLIMVVRFCEREYCDSHIIPLVSESCG